MTTEKKSVGISALGSMGGQEHYQHQIDGIYGCFSTPAGVVNYIQTKARLGSDGSNQSNLTKALVPAREALNVADMDFNQLLQRDLDDHRIATTLIPYILNPPANRLPGFFPPIVAVILPFNREQQPIENFPLSEPIKTEIDPEYGAFFNMTTYKGAFRVQYMSDEAGELNKIPLGILRWNPDVAKLVIMDGQHRAMSLLAIQRTITGSWDTTSAKGSRYKPFYEDSVKNLLEEAKANGQEIDLNNIELPVTICWLPDTPGSSQRVNPHKAARKLFVDVNNTAKPPSEARLVLLSDTKLENILARELLNQLRKDATWDKAFPLFGIEYDNPIAAATTPRRWSVVTNLEILKDAVVRTIFGPPKVIKDMGASLQGKPNLLEMDKHMRNQLNVSDLYPKEIHDGPRLIQRDKLGNNTFPINDSSLHHKLLTKFYEKWGKGILHLLSEVAPYKAHLQALNDRHTGWHAADNVQTLAKDALFEGVGMFWTIEDGHNLWLDQCTEAKEEYKPKPPQPDVSIAWNILATEQQSTFKKRRSEIYLDSVAATDITDCDLLFKGLITYAAQIGLVLSWVTIYSHANKSCNDPYALAYSMANAINKSLDQGPVASRNRKRIFLKECGESVKGFKPLNQLPRLEPAYANHFRYFWLELLLQQSNEPELEAAGIDLEKAKALLIESRKSYLSLLINERKKMRATDADLQEKSEAEKSKFAFERATSEIVESQAQARHYWFGGNIADCRNFINASLIQDSETVAPTDENDQDETYQEYVDNESMDDQILTEIVDTAEDSSS